MPAPDAAPEQPTQEDAPGRAPAGAGGPPSPPDVRPLIGRDEPLRVLVRAVEATIRGAPGFVEILGEPGIGKSRLLGELETSARARGLAVLSGRAAEFQHEVPLAVVVDALDDHLRTRATRLRGKLPGPVLDQLAKIFPALEAAVDAVPGADPVPADRYRGFSAVRDLLDALAAPSGLLVVLDDVHWADEASVELVDHLLRHPPYGRVLIAMAYRTAQVPPRLAAALHRAGTSCTSDPGTGRGPVRLHRIVVRPFDAREVEEFLSALTPDVPDDRTVAAGAGVVGDSGAGGVQGPMPCPARSRRLHAASRGNPFYLEALVRGDPGTGSTDPDPERSDPAAVPSPVRVALAAELDALPADALLVARAAAVVGDDFDPGQVAVAARISRVRTLDALDELAARDVVRVAAGTGRFSFRHPLVRHVAYSSAAAGWRIEAHAATAAHLAGMGAPATARAYHLARSAGFGDREAAAVLAEAARSVADRAPATAAHWLRAALRLLPEDVPETVGLLTDLARAQSVSGRLRAGRDTAMRVLELLPQDDLAARAPLVRLVAMMERLLGRTTRSRAVVLAELDRAGGRFVAAQLPLWLRLAAENMLRGEHTEATRVLDSVLADPASVTAPGLIAAVAAMRPMAAYAQGRYGTATRQSRRAAALVDATADVDLVPWLDSFAWLCWAELIADRGPVAAPHFQRALDLARASGQSYIETTLLAGQAWNLGRLGRPRAGLAAAEECVEISRLLGCRQPLVLGLSVQSILTGWVGEPAGALRKAEEAVAAAGHDGEWAGTFAHAVYAVALLDAGRVDTGTAEAAVICGNEDDTVLDPCSRLMCCEAAARAEALRGRPRAARCWADRAARLAAGTEPGAAAAGVGEATALLAHAHALGTGEPASAADAADRAGEILLASGTMIEAGRALLTAGTAHAAAGRRHEALDRLAHAARLFEDAGAHGLLGRTVREQRRLGARVPHPGATGARAGRPYDLSQRELDVVRRVVAGHTNQAIAEELHLSVRTVETHLSHVFAKLGVGSRVAVITTLTGLLPPEQH